MQQQLASDLTQKQVQAQIQRFLELLALFC